MESMDQISAKLDSYVKVELALLHQKFHTLVQKLRIGAQSECTV